MEIHKESPNLSSGSNIRNSEWTIHQGSLRNSGGSLPLISWESLGKSLNLSEP